MIKKWHNQKEILTPKTKVGKINLQSGTYTKRTYRKPNEQQFPKTAATQLPKLN